MRKVYRICLAMTLCFALLAGTLPASAASAEAPERISMAYINPLYRDVITETELAQPGVQARADVGEYHKTPEAAGAAIRDQMEARQETVSVGIRSGEWSEAVIKQLMREIFDAALTHTGEPTEGDYIRWVYAGWTASASGYSLFGTYYVTVTFTMTYYTTAEQEAELDDAVEALLSELDLDGLSDYLKVKAIYDWICDNITYDYDNTYLLKHTAYAALVNRTAVCQGYAVLLYRLLLTEGIDCRVIVGDSGGPHAWNIINLDGLYYNADSTWDSAVSTHRYFLLSQDSFTNHTREANYDTEAFHAAYPMSTTNYTPPADLTGDANGDGTLNMLDIVQIRELILHRGETSAILSRCDLNGNNHLDVYDIVAIRNLILA